MSRYVKPALGAIASVFASLCVSAAEPPEPGTPVSFTACPVARDMGPEADLCFYFEHEGVKYGLVNPRFFGSPQLLHRVLVEGKVKEGPLLCGGIPVEGIASVMPEIDANCNTMLPADERYTIDFNPRPPGPSSGRLAFAANPGPRPAPPPPPQGPQTVDIYFDFDKGVSFRHPGELSSILRIARQLPARRARITGVRGAHLLSDGTLLRESEGVGRRRAEEVAGLLRGAGLDAEVELDWIDGEAEADGVDDWRSRRVTVVLTP